MKRADGYLLCALAVTVVLWNVPYGEYVLYPFRIFATWMHETGHGIAAIVAGREFLHMAIRADTSGVAWHAGESGRFALAFVASAGYMGTSLVGAALVLLGRRERAARWVLVALGVFAFLSTALWVRNAFAVVAVPVLGVVLVGVGSKASRAVTTFVLNLLGAQSAVNAVTDIRALFVVGESTFDGGRATDAAAVADLLFLPYWFWAGLWMLLSLVLLAVALFAGRRAGGRGRAPARKS